MMTFPHSPDVMETYIMQVISLKRRSLQPGRLLTAAGLITCLALFSCKKDSAPKPCETKVISGKLSLTCDNVYEYRTTGGGLIRINMDKTQIIISHSAYEIFKIEFWGEVLPGSQNVVNFNHENLNGKHIKDRLLATRTLVFPDGTKLTMASTGMDQQVHTISIYEGKESHQFDFATKTVKQSSQDLAKAQQLDNAEADGEAASFTMDAQGLEFYNFYNETTPGNKVQNRVTLGKIIRNEPHTVNDYFDDPRLNHT